MSQAVRVPREGRPEIVQGRHVSKTFSRSIAAALAGTTDNQLFAWLQSNEFQFLVPAGTVQRRAILSRCDIVAIGTDPGAATWTTGDITLRLVQSLQGAAFSVPPSIAQGAREWVVGPSIGPGGSFVDGVQYRALNPHMLLSPGDSVAVLADVAAGYDHSANVIVNATLTLSFLEHA